MDGTAAAYPKEDVDTCDRHVYGGKDQSGAGRQRGRGTPDSDLHDAVAASVERLCEGTAGRAQARGEEDPASSATT